MSIKALGHHILVHVEKPEEKTKGGILLPDQVRDADRRNAEIGTVVDVGSTAYKNEGLGGIPWVAVGDRIFFAKYAGKWVQEPDQEDSGLLIIRDDDVVAKVEA